MKALFLTNEYLPFIYGGAGVHVSCLTQELAKSMKVEVRSFGEKEVNQQGNILVQRFRLAKESWACSKELVPIFDSLYRCIEMSELPIDANLVHCHTWYTHFAGMLAKLAYNLPLIITVHSLEPLRPWKRQQLGNGYECSAGIEKWALENADALIAVSKGTKQDLLKYFSLSEDKIQVIHNGIDAQKYQPVFSETALQKIGVNPSIPYLLFVGRLTYQKGIFHLLQAIEWMQSGFQIVICASSPDTPEIAHKMEVKLNRLKAKREGIFWVKEMLDENSKIELYSHASLFVCPSVYEPFGIINLEAMACELPVVASKVGGIPEVVIDGETGYLVEPPKVEENSKFAEALAEKVNQLMQNQELRSQFGKAGRQRVKSFFTWEAVACQTKLFYEQVLREKESKPII